MSKQLCCFILLLLALMMVGLLLFAGTPFSIHSNDVLLLVGKDTTETGGKGGGQVKLALEGLVEDKTKESAREQNRLILRDDLSSSLPRFPPPLPAGFTVDLPIKTMQLGDRVWDSSHSFTLSKIEDAIILKSGLTLNRTQAWHFHKWYWEVSNQRTDIVRNLTSGKPQMKWAMVRVNLSMIHQQTLQYYEKNDHLLPAHASPMEPRAYVSFVQIWQDVFQHIAFDSLPKVQFVCPWLLAHPDVHLLVMSRLEEEMIGLLCPIALQRFHLLEETLHARAIYVPHFDPPTFFDYGPPNCIRPLGGIEQGHSILYFSRGSGPKGKRFVLNEAGVLTTLRELFGEKLVVIPFLDLVEYNDEQTQKMRAQLRQARMIVGPHGGALSNMIFAPSHTIIVEIIPLLKLAAQGVTGHSRPCFFALANMLGFTYHTVEPDISDFDFDGPIKVPLQQLKEVLSKAAALPLQKLHPTYQPPDKPDKATRLTTH